jgi:SNF2 family DNA or RNA helicase
VEALQAWATGTKSHTKSQPLRLDPALATALAREATVLKQRAEGALTAAVLKTSLRGLRRPLFPYQVEGVARFLAAGRLLLADDMGLGKTAQAIASCHVLHTTGRVKRGLIIVPAALKPQWLREWREFTAAPAAIVDGNPSERLRQYRETKSGFLLVNYEQVLKDLPELRRFSPDLVVLDEAQRIKNWAAKTSRYVKQLEPRWRLVLSGTPLENRLTELASLMDWVDDCALEPKWRLTEWHTQRSDGAHEVVGARNLDTLRERLKPATLRRVRKEVLSQLPPRTDTLVAVTMTYEQQQAHAEFDRPIATLLCTSKRRPLTQQEFLRLMSLMTQQRVICNGLAQRDFEETWPALARGQRPSEASLRGLFSPKLVEFRELINNLVVTQGRKVVVFSQWKRMLRLADWAVSDVLEDGGARAVYFTGEESQKRRTQNIVDFHDDPRARVFFATDAGGVGLNLQRAASACVHLDLPWNPAVMEQRSGRIYRLGQTSPVEIYSLVSSSGIESRIASIVGSKKALFDGLFDGVTDAVQFEKGGSFMANLHKELGPLLPSDLGEDGDPAEDGTLGDDEDGQDLSEEATEEGDRPEDTCEPLHATAHADATATPTATPTPLAHGLAHAPAPVETTPRELLESSPSSALAVASSTPVSDLIAGIRVQRLEDGRLVLEAKPEAAATFAAMLEGVAAMLKQAAPLNPPGR